MARRNLLRGEDGRSTVANVELFFDLVFVFAVRQLSDRLRLHPTASNALETALLLALVWLVWVYTAWVTNWLDPARLPVRGMLLAVMAASLVLSAGLPDAFGRRGLWVGAAYAGMQVGRSVFAVAASRGDNLQRNFERILAWCALSGALAVAGGLVAGVDARAALWLGAVVVDLLGGAVGFFTPGLGRSLTADWTISGSHLAKRCQAFVLIALGESIVVTGGALSSLPGVSVARAAALTVSLVGVGALWWIYFDRRADAGAEVVERSSDPGRLGRSAYHFVHPVIVAGIIVTGAADERVLAHPAALSSAATAWLVLGGPALFLAGHAAFEAILWRVVPWTRLAAVVVLGLLGLAATALPGLALGATTAAVAVLVAAFDRCPHVGADPDGRDRPAAAARRGAGR